jgi:hypothetical protein
MGKFIRNQMAKRVVTHDILSQYLQTHSNINYSTDPSIEGYTLTLFVADSNHIFLMLGV